MGVPNAWKMDRLELWNTLEGTEHGKGAECGMYIVGVKDLTSAYVLCPRLAEYRGLSIYGWMEFTD